MKKLVFSTGIILMCCLFTSAFFAPPTSAQTQQTGVTQTTTYSESEQVYVLKSENNRLVVYRKGEKTPYVVTDSSTALLPQSDRKQLENGVEVKGKLNLDKAIEDYCS